MDFLRVIAETPVVALDPLGAFIREYGLPLFMFLATTVAWIRGLIRSPREVDREREISDDKQRTIDGLLVGAKEHTAALNAVATAVEERNRIEREMRGRRT